jgi:hypothetical protein
VTFRNSGRRCCAARQVGTWSDYTKPLELISLKTFNKNIIDKFFSDCDTSLSILRHDELQIWGLGTVGALAIRADGLRTWGDLDGLGHWGASSFQSTSQPTSQSVKLTTNRPAILSADQTFKRIMPSLIARESSTFSRLSRDSVDKTASLMTTGRRKQRYYYSRPPELDSHKSDWYHPSLLPSLKLRPARQSLGILSASASLRRFLGSFLFRSGVGRKTGGKENRKRSWATGKAVAP